MRTSSFVLAVMASAFAVQGQNQTTPYQVVERGGNYNIWQKTVTENGTNRVHAFTEIASGLNYTNESGQFIESKEQIEILPNGTAAATRGQTRAYFPSDIYSGVLEVVEPSGRHLYSRPLGVSLDDGSNSVWIGTLKHSIGVLASSNTVMFPDCMTGIKADLVAKYRKGSFECDLVIREKIGDPTVWGLNPDAVTIQLFTEFFNTEDPQQIPSVADE